MMVAYDTVVIQAHAEALYAQADSVVRVSAIVGALAGASAGAAAGVAAGLAVGVFVLVGALLGGLFGYLAAKGRALVLRSQAQTMLCQVRIEQNTREAITLLRGGAGLP
jgi:phage tail tape-measure protein